MTNDPTRLVGLTAKKVPHRHGTRPGSGLRPEEVGFIPSRTKERSMARLVNDLFENLRFLFDLFEEVMLDAFRTGRASSAKRSSRENGFRIG